MSKRQKSPGRVSRSSQSDTATTTSTETTKAQASGPEGNGADGTIRSTLTWLEHVNINVPNHDYIVPFYFELLGFGIDPRRAGNVVKGSKTVWANCGGSQFHLPYGDTAQVIPGQIGLRYDTLEPLKERLASLSHAYESYEIGRDPMSQQEYVKIVDKYGNVFFCRADEQEPITSGDTAPANNDSHDKSGDTPRYVQPLVTMSQTEEFGDVATKYGCDDEDGKSECRGISYVEFNCPPGSTAKIAAFYERVFGAITSVFPAPATDENASATSNSETNGDGTTEADASSTNGSIGAVALIAFGDISKAGRAEQYLLFRESSIESIPPYDGHHIALYVGDTHNEFEEVFGQALDTGVVWVNTRFRDDVMDLEGARHHNQFRFKNLIDIETGELLMELEHEVRSVRHTAFPGKRVEEE